MNLLVPDEVRTCLEDFGEDMLLLKRELDQNSTSASSCWAKGGFACENPSKGAVFTHGFC